MIGPLHARLVRADRATDVAGPMAESVDVAPSSTTADPTAYDAPERALYVYRQRRDGTDHVGIVCGVRPAAFADGRVRGHEAVDDDRVAGLVEHFARVPERSELVALLHRMGPVFATALTTITAATPVLDFVGPDGTEQTVWRVPDDTAAEVAAELDDTVLYVADGHHRVAAGLAAWRAAGEPSDAAIPSVVHALDGLTLAAFHRRVTGPVDAPALLTAADETLDVQPADGPTRQTGQVGIYAAGQWHRAGLPASERLDVSVLQDLLLGPFVTDPAQVLATKAPVAEIVPRVDADGGALFTLGPPALDTITGLADRGEITPAKTTYFAPKPYAGLFLTAPGDR